MAEIIKLGRSAASHIPGSCQPGARLPIYADNSTTVDVLVDLAHTTLPLPEYGFIPTPLEITVRSPVSTRSVPDNDKTITFSVINLKDMWNVSKTLQKWF
jgi:hypothetical protein